MPRTLLSTLIAVAATALLASGCGGDSEASAPPAPAAAGGGADAVTIDDFKFSPATLTVKAGSGVTFTNDDSTAHTATAEIGRAHV